MLAADVWVHNLSHKSTVGHGLQPWYAMTRHLLHLPRMICVLTLSLLLSQARELRIARTGPGAGRDAELERRTHVFNGKWVEEAAAKYLARKNNFQGL